MGYENALLLAAAARLYSLGVDLEGARESLRGCVANGVPYNSDEMRRAYNAFMALQEQFLALEDEYCRMRDGTR